MKPAATSHLTRRELVRSKATGVNEYLSELDPAQKQEISKVRALIIKNLNKGFVESMNWGMISYEVPLKTFAETYNGKPLMYAALAANKDHLSLYLTTMYADPEIKDWLVGQFEEAGLELDLGESCIRFNTTEDLPMEAIGKLINQTTVDQFVSYFKRSRRKSRK